MGDIKYDKYIEGIFGDKAKGKNNGIDGGMLQTVSGINYGISAMASMGSAISNYWQEGASANFLRIKAEQVGIQAEQKGNQLRESLYGAISNSFAGYAARGVDVGSGTPIKSAEMSLEEGGKDIAQIRKNAEVEAASYRAQADILKSGSTWNIVSGMANAISQGAMSYGLLVG